MQAYDLAIVTAGVRRPLGITDGLKRLVDLYNETAPQKDRARGSDSARVIASPELARRSRREKEEQGCGRTWAGPLCRIDQGHFEAGESIALDGG